MQIQNVLTAIKDEAGKPRADRGAKVKLAAVRFEQLFCGREFSAREFDQWQLTEPTLAGYKAHRARKALKKAGSRPDMPKPFQIVRTALQRWAVQPIEKAIFSDQLPTNINKQFKNWDKEIKSVVQAIDLGEFDESHQIAFALLINNYKHLRVTEEATTIAMQNTVDLMSALRTKVNVANLTTNTEGGTPMAETETESPDPKPEPPPPPPPGK